MDPDEPTHRTHHDWSGDVNLGYSVVIALSAVTGREPDRLRPLFETVDPEQLEALLTPWRPGGRRDDARVEVEFEHEGYRVRVDGTGEITLRRLDGGTDGGETDGGDAPSDGEVRGDG